MLRIRPFLAAPLLAALVVSGCTNPADQGESNTTPLPSADLNPRAAGDMQRGGELRLGVDKIGSLNPMSADQSSDMTDIRRAFMPTFFNYDEQGVAQPNTNFIQSATETSSDPTAVTIKLSPRAVWGDGQPITAKDVIATWNACNGKSQGFKCDSKLKFNQISQATQGASELEVQFTFAKAYPDWREVFTQVAVLRAESVKDANTFNTGWTKLEKGWTAGPFQVDKVDTAKGYLMATPSAVWWGDKPMLERLTVKQVKTADQPKAYVDNEIDTLAVTTPELFNTAKTVPEYALRKAGALTTRTLVINTKSSGAVSDPAVRKALLMSLDRSAIGTGALPGFEVKAAPQNNRFFLPGQAGYKDNVASAELGRDLGKARKALDEAGWKGDEKGRNKDSKALEVKLLQVKGVPTSELEVAAIKQQLEAVGFKVTVNDTTVEQFNSGAALSGGQFDLATMSTRGSRFPLQDAKDRYGSGAEENYARFEDPEVDRLVEQLATESDSTKRIEMANQIDRKLWDNVSDVPLYQAPEVVATKVRLANYGAPGLTSTDWLKVGYIR